MNSIWISEAMKQAIQDADKFKDGLPCAFRRKNREQWLETMPLEDWANIQERNRYEMNFDSKIKKLEALSTLSESETAYLADIDKQIEDLKSEAENAKKQMKAINDAAYHRWTGKMTESEEAEYKRLTQFVKTTPAQVNALILQKKGYSDEYRKLIDRREKSHSLLQKAEASLKTAEKDLEQAQATYDFETIVSAEKAVLIAKATLRTAEAEYKTVCDEVANYIPEWQKVAETLRNGITEDAEKAIREALKAVTNIAQDAIEKMHVLHETENLFDITGENEKVHNLTFDFDCGWLYRLIHEVESLMPKE